MENGRRRGKDRQQGPGQHKEKSGLRDEEAKAAVESCEVSGDLTHWQASPMGSQGLSLNFGARLPSQAGCSTQGLSVLPGPCRT